MGMSKTESAIVGVGVGATGLVLPFFLCWWIAAALSKYRIISMSESTIILVACAGLAAGILLDIRYQKDWVRKFYTARAYLIIMVYLSLSVVLFTIFMGFPVANIILGILAGLYVGRRCCHTGTRQDTVRRAAREIGFFTASVIMVETLPIAMLSRSEDVVQEALRQVFGLSQSAILGAGGITLMAVSCLILFMAQFWLTQNAARLAHSMGGAGRRSEK